MNLETGLKRVSAVWWGFWALLVGAFLVAAMFKGDAGDGWAIAGVSLLGLVAVYVAHRLTCWIIAGFFSPQS